MVDPALLRENAATVRTALQNRGADLHAELEELTTLEAQRRRLLPELEGLKREQNMAGEQAARPADQADGRRARIDRRTPQSRPADDSERATRKRSGGEERRRQRRGTNARRAQAVRLSGAGTLGSRTGTRHHRLRARHQD